MNEEMIHEEMREPGPPFSGSTEPRVVSLCTCGARWSHSPSATPEIMDSIFQSHVAYFKRTATRVD